ncbi:MAG: type II toxin-antitoxin system Phd/YefM family antitoxin [Candidatus Obscuribacterales bacterium]|nr:type II toxin-antitoxin system Phd/YefM family antitoxin [Candidatus Obscuribacterales bacterium]
MNIDGVSEMVEVNIHEAKTHLLKLIHRVMAGEEIIIAKSGVPVARIVPISACVKKRSPGSAEGKISMSDDFNYSLPDDLLDLFDDKA